ncbi:PucR family transcriptional regulator [Rubrobacter taiwanensis]|jgi:purine catabolism regulator|nr:helix-turn-helix domain-containing protein [Rubrobacter taiwanensis]
MTSNAVELLLERLIHSPDLRPFRALVEPLERYDRERGGDLVRTLRTFFLANGNSSETAERLFLHRNSLLYRLRRIEELAGLDLGNPRDRLALQLGLLAMERGAEDEDEHPKPAAGNRHRGGQG